MTLATNCPQCGTSFRITPEQLRQRGGIVRCGVCQQVFNALDALRTVGEPRPPQDHSWIAEPSAATAAVAPAAVAPAAVAPAAEAAAAVAPAAVAPAGAAAAYWPPTDEPTSPRTAAAASGTAFAAASGARPSTGSEAAEPGLVALRPQSDPERAAPPQLGDRAEDLSSARGLPPRPANGRSPADGRSPAAAAAARTRKSAAIAAAAVLGVLALLQIVLLARDPLGMQFPQARPALAALASVAGLQVELPRRLADLKIEGFDLQAGDAPSLLRMSAVLRNRGQAAVQWPAIELTLTDGDGDGSGGGNGGSGSDGSGSGSGVSGGGAVIVRRALLPAEYLRGTGARVADGIDARSEQPLRLTLEVPPVRSTSYTVNLFYP